MSDPTTELSVLSLPPSERTPGVEFDFAANRFRLTGESYPEHVSEFFGPLVQQLHSHLKALEGAEVLFSFELIYFNSSSAKVIIGLLELLDDVAAAGNSVTVQWCYEEEDEAMQEMGEEFGEDLENAAFVLKEITN